MSGQFSLYLETALLNHVFVGPVYPQPIGLFVAVFSTAPDQTGSGGVEISDPGYGRFGIQFATPTGTPVSTYNNAAIQWAPATQVWNAVACGLYDGPATVGTNYLGGGMIVDPVTGAWAPKTLDPGDVFRIPIGGLAVGFWTAAQPTAFARPPQIRVSGRVGPVTAEVVRAEPEPPPGLVTPGGAPLVTPQPLRMPGQAPRFPAPLPRPPPSERPRE